MVQILLSTLRLTIPWLLQPEPSPNGIRPSSVPHANNWIIPVYIIQQANSKIPRLFGMQRSTPTHVVDTVASDDLDWLLYPLSINMTYGTKLMISWSE